MEKSDKIFFIAISEKNTWWEIAAAKSNLHLEPPIVFTDRFFKDGFCTIVNEIIAFASCGCELEKDTESHLKAIVTLKLQENQLWIFVDRGVLNEKKFYIKRFNDGEGNGSASYDFIKFLLDNHPEGGMVEVVLNKSISIPRIMHRLGMEKLSRELFFGVSRGNKVQFHGSQIKIAFDEKCKNLISELEEMHQKAGNPEFPSQFL